MFLLPVIFFTMQTQAVQQRYSCEYITSDSKRAILGRRIISGTVNTAGHKQTWSAVTMDQPPAPSAPLSYMEGFSYDPTKKDVLTDAQTFKEFPSSAVEAKDIVSDMLEFAGYAGWVGKIKPGVETVVPPSKDHPESRVTLSGLGEATYHGHACTILKYESFFNKLEFSAPGAKFAGHSHRWGEVWVDQRSGTIVRATLKEDLLGEVTMQDAKEAMTMNILRKGNLEMN